jgi:hypothetical protein
MSLVLEIGVGLFSILQMKIEIQGGMDHVSDFMECTRRRSSNFDSMSAYRFNKGRQA